MLRSIYTGLVWSHPPAFRRRFGEELLCIFDETWRERCHESVFADVVTAVVRQWVFRSDLWIWCAALVGGAMPILIGYGSLLSMLDLPLR